MKYQLLGAEEIPKEVKESAGLDMMIIHTVYMFVKKAEKHQKARSKDCGV